MLYHLYSCTAGLPVFLEFVRKLIVWLEIPILKILFKLTGAKQVITRYSIHEKEHFNVFMSDLDFTLVGEQRNFPKLLRTHTWLKRIFLNIGELEFHTADEIEILYRLQSDPRFSFWNRIYILRKLSWQKQKLQLPLSKYERAKQLRAIKISLRKLKANGTPVLEKVFPELEKYERAEIMSFPYFSPYLEQDISVNEGLESLLSNDPICASIFISLLPDSDIVPKDRELRLIKLLLLDREVLLNHASMRIKLLQNKNWDASAALQWIEDLCKRREDLNH